jgi:outer membrane lipoprotein SlyB
VELEMKIKLMATAILALSIMAPALDFASAPAYAGNNYASESKRDYCANKARKYANKKVGNRTARNVAAGAVGGAILGGIFGGGGGDVAAGALIGGGVGVVGSAASNRWYKYYNRAYYGCINN